MHHAQVHTTNPSSEVEINSLDLAANPFGLRRAAYSVNETLKLLSLGRTSLYVLVRDGRLKPRKLGKKTLFLAPDLTRFLLELQRKDA